MVLPTEDFEQAESNDAHFHWADREGWEETLGMKFHYERDLNIVGKWVKE